MSKSDSQEKPLSEEEITLTSVDGIAIDATFHPVHESRGTIVLAHGITADKQEGGMFVRLAETLVEAGFATLRFSFRGHGKSGGTQRGMTIAGEMLDFGTAVEYAFTRTQALPTVIAASFGAVATCLTLPIAGDKIDRLVLWNPVLDLRGTFLEPSLPWGLTNFAREKRRVLETKGYLRVDGSFELGRVLFEEMEWLDPRLALMRSSKPAMIVHGDADASVSYSVSKQVATARPHTHLETIRGSDHGFDGMENEASAIRATLSWLNRIGG